MTAVMEPSLMPGTFMPDPDFSCGRGRFKASPFLPPEPSDPSWSSRKPHSDRQTTSNSRSAHATDNQQHSRKRPRLSTRSFDNDSFTTSRSIQDETLSPSPFVNTNYRIAGGLDTPTDRAVQQEEDVHEFDYEIDCRPNRYQTQPSQHTADSYFPQTPVLGQHSRNKRTLSPPSTPMKGWTKTVWALTGGFAGKVFNFCWNNTFNGFHAGGGNGYRFDIGTPGIASSAWTEVDSREDVFHNDYDGPSRRCDRESTPVPGGFPADGPDFIEDYMSQLTVNPEARIQGTPTKTSRTESPVVSRYNSWVVVDGTNNSPRSRESSPARKKSRASTANLYATQPSHPSCRPRLTPRSSMGRPSASYASPRPSLGANLASQHHTRRSTSSMPTTESSHIQAKFERSSRPSTPLDRPNSTRTHRASTGHHRKHSSISSPKPQQQSPEVRKFEHKMRKKEAKQDQTISRFNDRLQAMIQEGQAALGSRVEVEMSGDDDCELDEGYFDADAKMDISVWGDNGARGDRYSSWS